MKILEAIKSDSGKDFSSLFLSNVVQKFLGLIREIVVASILSSSLIYAHFLMLQSITGIFSQFTSGNSMRANLLPRVTKIINKYKKLSLNRTDKSLKLIMFWVFIIVQIIQVLVIIFLDSEYSVFLFFMSFLLSLIVCLNFYISVYLSIMQAQGKFLRYSIATSVNELVVTLFIYPLLFLFNILGFVISRLLGYISVIYFYIIPMRGENNGYHLTLGRNEFNIPTLILGNFANIIIFTSRFISGSDGGVSITYFTYSIFILNAILTAVIANISTLLLRRLSIKKDNMFMLYSILISLFIGILLIISLQLYGYDLVDLLFVRGNFTTVDALRTTDLLNNISYSFLLIFISTTLYQPFLSLEIAHTSKVRNKMAMIFIIAILLSFLFAFTQNLNVEIESLVVIYTCSAISMLLALYSYFFYLKQVN